MEHIRSETRNVLMLQYAILLLAVVSLAALACVAAENGVFGEKVFRVEDAGALHEAVNCFGVGVKCFIIYSIYRSHFFRGSFRIAVNLLLISAFFNAAWRILVSLGIYYYFDSSVAVMIVYSVSLLAAVIIEDLTSLAGLNFIMRGFSTTLDKIGEKDLASKARILGNIYLAFAGTLFVLLTLFEYPILTYSGYFISACCELLMFCIIRRSNRLIYQAYINGARH